VNCNCPPRRIAGNAALFGFAFGSKAKPLPTGMGKGRKTSQPPRLKITLIDVSTSTGSLLSR
jgi:hypothetical protein